MPSIDILRILRGSASNLLRVFLSMFVSLALPPFLVHRMTTVEYGAWVLILQLSAYVNFLDLGISTAIGKFIAEYDAAGQREASRRLVSTAFTVLCSVSLLASIALCLVVWGVPQLFHQLPAALVPQVRASLAAVGLSTCLGLPLSVFASVFNGLQRYGFPTLLYTVNRVSSAAALVIIVLLHGSLVQMALTLAVCNMITALLQVYGWSALLRHQVGFSLRGFEFQTARRLAEYCGVLSIWTLGNILISGLDTAIVARYDFANTAFYAAASSATNFMLLVVGSLMSPLMPALSSAQLQRTPAQMGELVIKATRYGALLMVAMGIPLVSCAYPLLACWVGQNYAIHGALFLQVLVLGNVLRQLAAPYSIMIVAVGKQRLATLSPVAESLINLAASVYLAKRMGALGVALGTIIGALVGLILHLSVSMGLTRSVAQIRRTAFLIRGLLWPAVCLLPFLLLLPWWRPNVLLPWPPLWMAGAALASVAMAWYLALNTDERTRATLLMYRLLSGDRPTHASGLR
jgi:O-antigen/teichoic acid export membrane protein